MKRAVSLLTAGLALMIFAGVIPCAATEYPDGPSPFSWTAGALGGLSGRGLREEQPVQDLRDDLSGTSFHLGAERLGTVGSPGDECPGLWAAVRRLVVIEDFVVRGAEQPARQA